MASPDSREAIVQIKEKWQVQWQTGKQLTASQSFPDKESVLVRRMLWRQEIFYTSSVCVCVTVFFVCFPSNCLRGSTLTQISLFAWGIHNVSSVTLLTIYLIWEGKHKHLMGAKLKELCFKQAMIEANRAKNKPPQRNCSLIYCDLNAHCSNGISREIWIHKCFMYKSNMTIIHLISVCCFPWSERHFC